MPKPVGSRAAASPRRPSSHSRRVSDTPMAMPTKPITTDPSTWPAPHRLVIHSVRRLDQRRAALIATNGR